MATLSKMFGKKGSSNSLYKLGDGSSPAIHGNSSAETITGTAPSSRSKFPIPHKKKPETPPPAVTPQAMAQIVLKEMGDAQSIEPKRFFFHQTDKPPAPFKEEPLPARWVKNGEIKCYNPDVEYYIQPDGSVKKYPPPWEPPQNAPSLPHVDKASIYKQLNKSSTRLGVIAEQKPDEEQLTTSRAHYEAPPYGLRRKISTPAMRNIAPPVPAPGFPAYAKQSLTRPHHTLAQIAMSNARGKMKVPVPVPSSIPVPPTVPMNPPILSNDEGEVILRGAKESGEPRRLSVNHVYRYRKQYGMNVESWFFYDYRVMGPLLGKNSRTEEQYVQMYDSEAVRDALEKHYTEWMCEADFFWLRERGFNTIRVGIPYWALIGIDQMAVPQEHRDSFMEVYGRAWTFLLEKIEMASNFGFGVLAVLQEAAGGHNQEQSLFVGAPAMFKAENSRVTIRALVALVKLLHVYPNVVGVELLAEPDFDQQLKLQRWYERAIEAIRSSLPPSMSEDFPIYIPDSWDPGRFAKWVGGRQDFVVLDHHVSRVFRTFNHRFINYWYPMGLDDILHGTFGEKLEELQAATNGKAIIGAWYTAQSDTRDVTSEETMVVVGRELAMFRKHCPGNFFCHYKAAEPDPSTAVVLYEHGLFPIWLGGRNPKQPVNDLPWHLFGRYKEKAVAVYMKINSSPEDTSRAMRVFFEDGFAVGWDDAITFATAIGVCELGFRQRWVENRTREYRDVQTALRALDPLPEFGEGVEVGFDIATALLLGPIDLEISF